MCKLHHQTVEIRNLRITVDCTSNHRPFSRYTGQIIYLTSSLQYFIYFTLCLKLNIYFTFLEYFFSVYKVGFQTRLKETSEARLHKFKCDLMMLSEVIQISLRAIKYLFTTCPWDNYLFHLFHILYFKNTPIPPPPGDWMVATLGHVWFAKYKQFSIFNDISNFTTALVGLVSKKSFEANIIW